MNANLIVDETKAKGYLVVAAIASPADLTSLRRTVRGLLLPGQRSVHMKNENARRRHSIADTIAGMRAAGVIAVVYDAGREGRELDRRARCLRAIVADTLATYAKAEIVFDLDDTVRSFDQQRMIEYTRADRGRISYTHAHRDDEPLISIPDAIAWCWARGGDWRRRIEPIVADVRGNI